MDAIEMQLEMLVERSGLGMMRRLHAGGDCIFLDIPSALESPATPFTCCLAVDTWRGDPFAKLHESKGKLPGDVLARTWLIATLLDVLDELVAKKEPQAGVNVIFHQHPRNMNAFLETFRNLFLAHPDTWIIEPTGLEARTSEKSTFRIDVEIKAMPGSHAPCQADAMDRVASSLGELLLELHEPSHEIYDLGPNAPYREKFLVGAPSISLETTRGDRGVMLHVFMDSTPVDTSITTMLLSTMNQFKGCEDSGITCDVSFLDASAGSRFPVNTRFYHTLETLVNRIAGNGLYIDWHQDRTIGSSLFRWYPELPVIIFGPKAFRDTRNWKRMFRSKESEPFREIMEALLGPGRHSIKDNAGEHGEFNE
ncbi:hypothetical protein GF325_06415 [Candidatus Bathyarchaeota archaeon]|nr:hypothetical protein [Candidatus Bathyarchaeota archaeon]